MAERRGGARRLWWWVPAVVLTGAGAFAAGRVVAIDGVERAEARGGGPAPTTPMLSPRRALTFLAEPVADRRLRADLTAFVAEQPDATCLVVRSTADEELLFAHQPDRPLVPASAQKLATAAAVLLALEPDERFVTTALAAAPIEAGTVAGDLHLVGGGDPILATPDYAAGFINQPQTFTDFTKLADAIAATGLTRVEGAVVGDEARYDGERYVALWPPRFATQDQTGPLSALYVNDGFVEYSTRPGDGVDEEPAADPPAAAAERLTAELVARGVEVVGPPRSGPAPAGATELAAITSPPVVEIVAQMLAESDNSTAELLVKELGLRLRDEGSTAAGRAAIAEVLDGAGLGAPGVTVADGSGLASENRLTCAMTAGLLDHDPIEATVRAGLAVAGQTGTLTRRYAGTPLEGRLRAKTGSLNQVTALAGFAETGAGPLLTFALIANVDAPDRIDGDTIAAQQRLGEILLGHPRQPELEGLGPEPAAGTGGVA